MSESLIPFLPFCLFSFFDSAISPPLHHGRVNSKPHHQIRAKVSFGASNAVRLSNFKEALDALERQLKRSDESGAARNSDVTGGGVWLVPGCASMTIADVALFPFLERIFHLDVLSWFDRYPPPTVTTGAGDSSTGSSSSSSSSDTDKITDMSKSSKSRSSSNDHNPVALSYPRVASYVRRLLATPAVAATVWERRSEASRATQPIAGGRGQSREDYFRVVYRKYADDNAQEVNAALAAVKPPGLPQGEWDATLQQNQNDAR